MKSFFVLIVCLSVYFESTAQIDTIHREKADSITIVVKADTINIAGLMFTKSKKKKNQVTVTLGRKHDYKPSSVSTDWWIFDIGLSNYIDKTNYGISNSYLVNKPGSPSLGENDFKLRTGKSINVNIWIFMQRLNLIKHYLNLKYGLGLELNNYRYTSSISYKEGGTIPYSNPSLFANSPFIYRDSISFTKNKLAADYLTVPIMLNFASNPRNPGKNFLISAGISAGYLYSERNKQISAERGKQKNRGDYDLQRFKLSYIGEIGLGEVRLYGSYSPVSFYQKALDMRPYTIGIRLSNW